jgi:hypothetical protein
MDKSEAPKYAWVIENTPEYAAAFAVLMESREFPGKYSTQAIQEARAVVGASFGRFLQSPAGLEFQHFQRLKLPLPTHLTLTATPICGAPAVRPGTEERHELQEMSQS